mmetsp:Transcript_32035/g.77741  ORF Transcript_32035/g.77741 Transcript_32035/m.77741 type:complete len:699 (-) Transcript_32035:188-2284(-)
MAAGAGDHLMLARLGLVDQRQDTIAGPTCFLHENPVSTFAFAAGLDVLYSGAGKRLSYWSVETCTRQKELKLEGEVSSVSLSPDCTVLASGGSDKKVTLWSVPDGKKVASLQMDDTVNATVFSADGEMLAAAGTARTVRVWRDWREGGTAMEIRHGTTVSSLAFSKDGALLASGGLDSCVRVWGSTLGELRSEINLKDAVLCVAFSALVPSEGVYRVAAGDRDGCVSMWELQQPPPSESTPRTRGDSLKATLAFELPHDGAVFTLDVSHDGEWLASGGADQFISLWNIGLGDEAGRKLWEAPGDDDVKAIRFSRDSTVIGVATGEYVRLLSIVHDDDLVLLKPHFSEEAQRAVSLPLLHAAKEGELRMVDNLLSQGQVDVNFANQHGDTALILSCWYGHKWIASRLLDHRAAVDLANCDGNTALNAAAYRGNDELVRILLANGATVDVPDKMTGKTALVKAAYVGHEPSAIILLENGANVNHADSQGYTALAFATSFNHEYMQQVLLEAGADPNVQDEYGITPLIHAAARGLFESVLLLLQVGANAAIVDCEGRTAADYAESAGFEDIVHALQQAEAELNSANQAAREAQRGSGGVHGMPKLNISFGGGAVTPRTGVRMTPRVPGAAAVAQRMTPRVPQGFPPSHLSGAEVAESPPLSAEKLMSVHMDAFAYLTKKLVQLSVLLEQDTIAEDTRYPTF